MGPTPPPSPNPFFLCFKPNSHNKRRNENPILKTSNPYLPQNYISPPKKLKSSMQNKLQHGGGAVTDGPLSREEVCDMVISSEESSSYPDELELGLGLSLGGGNVRIKPTAAGGGSWDRARVLTAKDFLTKDSSSSSSSSSSVTVANVSNKRAAESPSSPPPRSAISQVVGWPPVRTYRMNSLANQSKSPVTEDFFSSVDKSQTKNTVPDEADHGGNKNNAKEKGLHKTSLFVKVNMDGIPIGRKVDLNSQSCYDSLARALDDMFGPSAAFGASRLNAVEQVVPGARQTLQLLGGSSDFVLTYEDKEGDWMLVGDVPWEMFLNSVRRLRIMRTAEANGLGSNEWSRKPSTVPI